MRAIFICWDEEVADPYKVYVGEGCYDTRWRNQRLKTHHARWSNTVSDEMLAKAKEYAQNGKDMQGRQNVRVEILDDETWQPA